ncbi:MAG: SxtJ family membrane protein [Pseudomonadales bacterium]
MTVEIPQLDAIGLRKFGLQFAAIVAALFGLFIPWLFDLPWQRWPWIIAALVATWSLVAPGSMSGFYRLWMRFGLVLNRFTSPIVLGILFFGVFTPTALALKLLRKKLLEQVPDAEATSYRVSSATDSSSDNSSVSSHQFENPY